MKRLLLATTVLAGTAAAASAADLPRRAAPPVFVPVPVFTWTGFYAGFNAGYGFGTNDNRGTTVIAIPGALTSQGGGVAAAAYSNRDSNDGFVGGGQIGYNYQLTPGSGVVVGIEADAQYVDFGRRRNAVGLFNAAGGALTAAPGVTFINPNGVSSLDYFGTVRGRLGYAFDRTLVYATGGFAYGSGGGREFGLPGTSSDEFKTGYAVGGGVEYALPTDSFLNFFKSSAVTFKVEGLYVNLDQGRRLNGAYAFDTANNVYAVPANGTVLAGSIARRDTEFAVVRAGINYKFGSY